MTTSVPPADDALEVLLRFGALMLQAGNTAVRTRRWIDAIAPKLGFEAVSAVVSLDSITVGVRRRSEWLTAIREIGPPGINVSRIAQLEQLARTVHPESTPAEIAAELAKIEAAAPRYSFVQIAAAVGLASGGFAGPSSVRVMLLRYWRIGNGLGSSAIFQSTIASRSDRHCGVSAAGHGSQRPSALRDLRESESIPALL